MCATSCETRFPDACPLSCAGARVCGCCATPHLKTCYDRARHLLKRLNIVLFAQDHHKHRVMHVDVAFIIRWQKAKRASPAPPLPPPSSASCSPTSEPSYVYQFKYDIYIKSTKIHLQCSHRTAKARAKATEALEDRQSAGLSGSTRKGAMGTTSTQQMARPPLWASRI